MTPCSSSVKQNVIHSHTYPVRAEQACVRQSLFPILLMQSLNAVLMSGIDRQVCKGTKKSLLSMLQEMVTFFQNESYHIHSSASVRMAQLCSVKPPHPLTQQIHFFTFQKILTYSFFTKENAIFRQYTHTATPP